jgi:hypothetical protein
VNQQRLDGYNGYQNRPVPRSEWRQRYPDVFDAVLVACQAYGSRPTGIPDTVSDHDVREDKQRQK